MIARRVRKYVSLMGVWYALVNAALLAYLFYLAWSVGGPALAGVMAVVTFGLPLLVLPVLVRIAPALFRAVRVMQFIAIAFIVINVTGVVSAPGLVVLGFVVLVYLMHGAVFWVASDPRIVTADQAAIIETYLRERG